MKKFFKKLFHFHHEKPYKRALRIFLPILIILIAAAGVQYQNPLRNAFVWTGDKITSVFLHKQSGYLKYDKAVFARVTGKEGVIFLDKPVYERGEPVHFALMKVGPFKKDAEGKNWVDMDLLVIDPAGNVAMKKEHLLGEGGHLKLDNDTAPSPDGVYVPRGDVKLGKYKVSLRVYDRIGGGEVKDSGEFELIKQKLPSATESQSPSAKTDSAEMGNTPEK